MCKDLCWCLGPIHFALLGVDDLNSAPPYEKVCKRACVIDVIVIVPSSNGGCCEAPVD